MAARARATKAPQAETTPDAATKPDTVTAETATPAETTPDATANPDTAPAEIKTRVKTLQEGQTAYWRGGQAHTRAWQTWPAGTFSAEQAARLEADERVEVEAV